MHRVQELEKEISKEYRKTFLQKTVHVLIEEEKNGYFEGLSDEYIRVSITDKNVEKGRLYSVYVENLTEDGLIGRVQEEE